MTRRIINYSGMTEKEGDAKALRDLREYLGLGKYAMLIRAVRKSSDIRVIDVMIALDIAGVEGRPVQAFLRHYMPKRWAEFQLIHKDKFAEARVIVDFEEKPTHRPDPSSSKIN